jgi:inhibitor of KinA sporulation pathway (predicted exonuclease)/predicted RNA-binding Zn-ribbon protein involved in translation (DUF1610 family)
MADPADPEAPSREPIPGSSEASAGETSAAAEPVSAPASPSPEPGSPSPSSSFAGTRPRFLVCIDLEATCDDDPSVLRREDMEVIEFPWVVVDSEKAEVVRTGRQFVKPEYSPITAQCTALTGITPQSVSDAGTLADAVGALGVELHSLLDEVNAEERESNLSLDDVCCVTHGTWDLGVQLPREAARKDVAVPTYLSRFFDARAEVATWLEGPLPTGAWKLPALCRAAGAEQHGREHCGLDDAMSVANIVIRVLQATGRRDATIDAFCASPMDLISLRETFDRVESRVVRVLGLPFRVTRPEMAEWCQKVDVAMEEAMIALEPAPFNNDMRPSGDGFIICRSHDDAVALLSNTTMLGPRWIEVYPSTTDHITSSPTRKIADQPVPSGAPLRPGDWVCSRCGDHQFARNVNCRRCRAPKGSGSGANPPPPPPGGGSAMMGDGGSRVIKEGDWICPQCNDHQFARNLSCRRCRAPRPANIGMGGGGMGGGHHTPPLLSSHPPSFAPPLPSQGSFSAPRQMREGDWNCPQCGDHQFARNTHCRKCQAPRPHDRYEPQPRYEPLEPSRGGYSGHSGHSSSGGYGGVYHDQPPRGYDAPSSSSSYGGYADRRSGGGYGEAAPVYEDRYGGGGGGGGGDRYEPRSRDPPRYDSNDRYRGGGGGGSSQPPMRAGDWMCERCNDLQFARNTSCRRCGSLPPASSGPV